MTTSRRISNGWASINVPDAYAAGMAAAGAAGMNETVVLADVQAIIAASRGGGEFVGNVLERQLLGV